MHINSQETIFEINYSLEKMHTSMLKYLGEKSREHCNKILNGFKEIEKELEWNEEDNISFEMEYQSVDLVIKKNNKVWIIIEMKIDSGEGDNQLKKYYEKFSGEAVFFFYITLGVGEYFVNKLSCKKFEVIGLEKFINIIDSLKEKNDSYYNDWIKSLRNEISRRQRFECTEKRRGNDLLEAFNAIRTQLGDEYKWVRIYKHGIKPDIIMNFGYDKIYCEINDNLTLNIKMANDVKYLNREKFIDDNIKKLEINLKENGLSHITKNSIDGIKNTKYKTLTIFKVNIFEEEINIEILRNEENLKKIAANLKNTLNKLFLLIDEINKES